MEEDMPKLTRDASDKITRQIVDEMGLGDDPLAELFVASIVDEGDIEGARELARTMAQAGAQC